MTFADGTTVVAVTFLVDDPYCDRAVETDEQRAFVAAVGQDPSSTA
ncbi:MAG: hypothetical protein HYX34_10575 [Actinobacteria bacterium]|nr:hypothetical protein [Actinomycetota bacterium]